MRIDEYEYVCEVCGCIYSIEKLEFVEVENNPFVVNDEYDVLFERAVLEEAISLKQRQNINIIDTSKIIKQALMVTYKCPVCNCTVCMPDRRSMERS